MQYAPHILFVRKTEETRDSYNRVTSVSESWKKVGLCRCDDNATPIVSTLNTKEYVPRYHIVTSRTGMISPGDMVRVLTQDGTLRGEGKADNVRTLNYLDYTDFYAGN